MTLVFLFILSLSIPAAYWIGKIKQKKIISNLNKNLFNAKVNSNYEILKKLENSMVIFINESGRIECATNGFWKTFSSYVGEDHNWDDFVQENFLKERKFKDLKNHFKYIHDIKSDYFLFSSIDPVTQKRVCEIQRIHPEVMTTLSKGRYEMQNKHSVNAVDILDEIIARDATLRGHNLVKFADISNAEDNCIYLNDKQAKLVFDKFLKSLHIIQKIFDGNQRISLKLRRADGKFIMTAKIPEVRMKKEAFDKIVRVGQESTSLSKTVRDL